MNVPERGVDPLIYSRHPGHDPLIQSVGRELGIRLCENLGLDPKDVYALDFHWRPDTLPTVTAELRINEGTVREATDPRPDGLQRWVTVR